MRIGSWYKLATLIISVALTTPGCVNLGSLIPGVGGGIGPFTVPLEGTVADFPVQAGVPFEKTILLNLSVPAAISGGTFTFPTDAISFSPAGPAKGLVNAQTGPFSIQITGFAFAQDDETATCGDGDVYGPYTVGIDAEGQAVSIEPLTFALQPDTIALVNADNLAICVRVESPVSGTVRIGAMEFGVSAGTTDVQ